MLKETIRFTDFNDQPAVTVEYFNLTKNEIIDLEDSIEGGLAAMMRKVEDNPTAGGVLNLLKTLTHAAYGIKSDDGKFFDKSPEITNKFVHSAFYDDFLFSLLENDSVKGLQFIRGIIPSGLLEAAEAQVSSTQANQQATAQYQPSARDVFAQATPPSQFVPQPAPEPLQTAATAPAPAPTVDEKSYAEFQAWQARQAQDATDKAAREASERSGTQIPAEAFRVQEPDPYQGLPRPAHEQAG